MLKQINNYKQKVKIILLVQNSSFLLLGVEEVGVAFFASQCRRHKSASFALFKMYHSHYYHISHAHISHSELAFTTIMRYKLQTKCFCVTVIFTLYQQALAKKISN